MGQGRTKTPLCAIQHWLSAETARLLPDKQLIERYVRQRDNAAFASMVERHGPMVWRVCRRMLGDGPAAEDAYQATFLVLMRKAAHLGKRELLANWLYGVAYRVAARVRVDEARRRNREARSRPRLVAEPLAEVTRHELCAVLDEAMVRLPERYRMPFLLCHVEGRTRDQAAQELGCSLRTLDRRLARGRDLLRARLGRRGMTLSAGLLAAGLAEAASASTQVLPPAIAYLGPAWAAASHQLVSSGSASPKAAALAEAALRAMTAVRLKAVLLFFLALSLGGPGVGLLVRHAAIIGQPGRSEEPQTPPIHALDAPELIDSGLAHRDVFGDPLPTGALARMGTVQWRHYHSSADLAAAFTSDSKTVITGGNDTLKAWDLATGKLRLQAAGHYGRLLLAPNGKWLFAASEALLDPATLQVVRRLSPGGYPLAFSPDSALLATSGDGVIYLWSTADGRMVQTLQGHQQGIGDGAFSFDGRSLVTVSHDKKVCHWDVATGILRNTVIMPIPGSRTLELSPDGRTLAVPYSLLALGLWDTETGKERCRLQGEHAGSWYGLAFSPDSGTLATTWQDPRGNNAEISVWDASTGKLRRRFVIPGGHGGGQVAALYFAPDNRTLLSSSLEPRLRLWDTLTGQAVAEHLGHEGGIESLMFTPDGRQLLSGAGDGTIRVWDSGTGHHLRELARNRGGISGLAVTPDGQAVLSGGLDEQLVLQNLQTGKDLRRLELVPEKSKPTDGSYSPQFVLSGDGTIAVSHIHTTAAPLIHVWEVATGRVLVQRADLSKFNTVAFSPDAQVMAARVYTYAPESAPKGPMAAKMKGGAQIITGTRLVFQDVTTGRQLLSLSLPQGDGYPTAFSPDGRTVVTYSQPVTTDERGSHWGCPTLHFWELASGKERRTIASAKSGWESEYISIGFSPDGRHVATARNDKTIQLWDAATGQQVLLRRGYEAPAHVMAFRPDGSALATGHADSTILLWDLTPATVKREATARPQPSDWEEWWEALADADAVKAFATIWRLVAQPEQAVPFIRSHVPKASGVSAEQLQQWIADLNGPHFRVREAGSKQLAERQDEAEVALTEALKGTPSAEVRRRIESLLAAPRIVRSPEQLRSLRAIEVLEHIGSPSARQLLADLATGFSQARLTQQARASLERLAKRPLANR